MEMYKSKQKKDKMYTLKRHKIDIWRVACYRPPLCSPTGEGRGENGEFPGDRARVNNPLCAAAAAGVVVCDCAQCHT